MRSRGSSSGKPYAALMARGASAAVIATAILATALSSSPAAQPLSPSAYLGKQIGADGVLADYSEIWRYFAYLDSASDWIAVLDLGKTTLGNRFLMAIATDPANMTRLDRYRSISQDLRDGRVSPEEAASLADEGKVILLNVGAIHSDEIAATQMSLDLAYRIAAGDPEIAPYLGDVILLIAPSLNPDGHNMVVDFYNKWKGTEYDGNSTPYLYHPYAGHDDNRDWYMFNLPETRLVSDVIYRTWVPQVLIDHHQMWMTGARLFVPPYTDPVNPNLDPLMWREIGLVCASMHLKLQEKGARGVIHSSEFPGWWEGAASMTPLWHNVVSILTEAASCRIATPVFVDPSELDAGGAGFPKYTKLTNFPDPWPGGQWRLRDIMDYQILSVIGALEACSNNRRTLLENSYRMSTAAIEKGKTEKPYAFILPPSEDNFTQARLIERLMMGGVQVHQATADFVVAGRTLPVGSYVIFMAQPYRAYAKDMLERQDYPEIRIAPEAPPLEPYDETAWTMPLKMGLECVEASIPVRIETRSVERVDMPESVLPRAGGHYVAVSRGSLAAYVFANRALRSHLQLYTSPDTIRVDSQVLAPGAILVDLGKEPYAALDEVIDLASNLGLNFIDFATVGSASITPIRQKRIGIVFPYLENESLGWLKYVLEDFEFDYKVLRPDEVKRGHLSKNYDVIIVQDVEPGILKDGKPSGRWAEFFEPLPPEYSGGIGDDGVKAIKAFVDEGGTLVTTVASCDFAITTFELPAKDILADFNEEKFSCPGAILALSVDPKSSLGWGLEPRTPCLFTYSRAFSTRVPYGKFGREVVATYADRDLLLSGWLRGADTIAGRPAIARFSYGKGNIVMCGFDPIRRAQTYSTYRILFNALL